MENGLGEKRGNRLPSFLTPEQYQARLGEIRGAIVQALREAKRESYEDYGCAYGIRGVVICGNCAGGNIHPRSTIDIYTLATTDPLGLNDDLIQRLKEKGVTEKFGLMGYVNYEDPDDVRKKLMADDVVGRGFVVVTPFPKVQSAVESALKAPSGIETEEPESGAI